MLSICYVLRADGVRVDECFQLSMGREGAVRFVCVKLKGFRYKDRKRVDVFFVTARGQNPA